MKAIWKLIKQELFGVFIRDNRVPMRYTRKMRFIGKVKGLHKGIVKSGLANG